MPASVAGLRYPSSRVLLPRTRLAYIHLRNLLTDAKRDRAARVWGYVAIWLPEEFVVFYLQNGEAVNATVRDGSGSRAISIAEAIELVPTEPEYGEICFHEAETEQLACMFTTQTEAMDPWPSELSPTDPVKLFPYLNSTVFDGVVEIVADDTVNYLVFEDGSVSRAFLAASHHGTLVDRVAKLFTREGKVGRIELHRWASPMTLPVQAPPALVHAYRDLMASLIRSLEQKGRSSAAAIAEHARHNLLASHPALDGFSANGRVPSEPIVAADLLTSAVAAWIKEVVWAAVDHDTTSPESLMRDLAWDRRHMLQSAGLFDKLPWKIM
jgi:hypothetical protein